MLSANLYQHHWRYDIVSNLFISWKQLSEFLHRDKQNNHFGPD